MKRFIFSILAVTVFFLGVGALVEQTGAKFKSDEKALDLIKKARVAIGGDAAVASVQSLRIVGQTTRTFKINGSDNVAQSETEIALQFPDKFMKMTKVGKDDGMGMAERTINKQVDVVVVGDSKEQMKVTVNADGQGDGAAVARKIVIKKDDGTVQELTGEEADKFIASHHPGGAGAAHTIMLKKNADGTVEQVGGAEGQTIILRKAEGGNVTWTTKDGKTVEKVGGGDEKVMIHKTEGGNVVWTSKDGKTEKVVGGEGGKVMVRTLDGGPATLITKDDMGGKDVMFARTGGMKQNDFLRTTLGLLLTAPQGMDVSYTFGGEGDVDGTACNIVNAAFGGSSYKLYLSKSSNLPVMMSYAGSKEPQVFTFRTKAPDGAVETKDVMTFNRKIEGDGAGIAEFSVKFSDYRAVNGVQLPYKWTQTVGGAIDETFDVTSYEVNPANIAEKFQGEKVMVRTVKPDNK